MICRGLFDLFVLRSRDPAIDFVQNIHDEMRHTTQRMSSSCCDFQMISSDFVCGCHVCISCGCGLRTAVVQPTRPGAVKVGFFPGECSVSKFSQTAREVFSPFGMQRHVSLLPHSHVQNGFSQQSHVRSLLNSHFHRKFPATKHRDLMRRKLARSPFSARFNKNGKHMWSTEYIQREHTNHVDQK